MASAVVRGAELPFVGVLESPLPGGPPELGERLELRGWALSEPAADYVAARLDTQSVRLDTGIARADVARAFADRASAAAAGFSGWLDLEPLAAGRYGLTVQVSGAGRTVHEWERVVAVGDLDAEYRAWRRRVAALHRMSPAPARPLATWVVAAGDGAAETAAALRRDGSGCWEAVVAGAAGMSPIGTPYVGLLHAGDRLASQAAAALQAGLPDLPAPDFVYVDHDHIGADGEVGDPVFKPSWSPLLLRHPDVAARGWLVRTALLEDSLAELLRPGAALPAAVAARCRSGWRAALPLLSFGTAPAAPGEDRATATGRPLTVVVPTRLADRGLLARCLDGLRREQAGRAAEIVVVLNNLREPLDEARRYVERWSARVVHDEGPFNWSRLNNRGARHGVHGELLLFLNDDVEPTTPGWLDALLALARAPGIGAVGAVLRYPDGRIQHAGVYLAGGAEPDARHTFRHCSGRERRVARWLTCDRTQTAVTGACLLTPRDAFDAAGGFDEALAVVFNDVDYCLRLAERGLSSAVAAGAILTHHEGFSRGGLAEDADRRRFAMLWSSRLPACDPFSHPSLRADRDDWMFDPGRLPFDACPIV